MSHQCDQTYGPTTAPQGAGRIMEVMADHRHPNLPEFEHNVVWYKFTVPYNGKLDIAVTQQDLKDDYDMLVYKYTDVYFSNHIQSNKVWAGMAKETAHQLGTPLSSLMGWIELMKMQEEPFIGTLEMELEGDYA